MGLGFGFEERGHAEVDQAVREHRGGQCHLWYEDVDELEQLQQLQRRSLELVEVGLGLGLGLGLG